jgi:murein DD-endopeptidase MepM/ murein hydrolase activator NlpD
MGLSTPHLRRCGLALLAVTPFASPADALGHTGEPASGETPAVESTRCESGGSWTCAPRQRLVLRGHSLGDVTSVAFIGRRGGRDDRFAPARSPSKRRVVVIVPSGARSGLLRIRTTEAVARTSTLLRLRKRPRRSDAKRLAAAEPVVGSTAETGVFPINGEHDMGQSTTNDFGGARGHGGQDMFAACGTPLVASVTGTVQAKGYQSAAGHYVVLQDQERRSHVYMHMASASGLDQGDSVEAGQPVGAVGQTGRSTGCHLHFELWTGPGWYSGGEAIDPLPRLRQWESEPHPHN